MNTQSHVSPYDFSALSLVGQAFRLIWAHLWLFLWWSLPPLAVSVVTVWRGELFYGQAEIPDEPWVWGVALPLLLAWLLAVSLIRVMRFTILGERPGSYVAVQMFQARTWRYILVSLWIYFQVLLMGVFALGIPCYAAFLAAAQRAVFSNQYQLIWFLVTEFLLMFALGAFILVGRAVLFSPNIAVDGTLRLSQLGERSGPATRALVRTYLLVFGVPALLFWLPSTLFILGIIPAGSNFLLFVKVNNTLNVLMYVVQLVVCSLAYQRLRPLLEREDQAPQAVAAPADAQP